MHDGNERTKWRGSAVARLPWRPRISSLVTTTIPGLGGYLSLADMYEWKGEARGCQQTVLVWQQQMNEEGIKTPTHVSRDESIIASDVMSSVCSA